MNHEIISNINTIDLLNDFLYNLYELYEKTSSIQELFSSNDCTNFVSEVEKHLKSSGYDNLAKRFLDIIKSAENEELLDFSSIEDEINKLRIEIEKNDYRNNYKFVEGVYSSDNEDLVVKTEWTSTSRISHENPFMYVSQAPQLDSTDETLNIHTTPTETDNTSPCQNKKITPDSAIEELELPDIAYCPLKREGAKTVNDIFKFIDGTLYCRSLGRTGMEAIITKLQENGFLLQKNCTICGSNLLEDDLSEGNEICANCHERIRRTLNAKDVILEVLPPEESSYSGNERGFHIYINVKNNTLKPIKLELTECSIFKNGRQNSSNYNLHGYSFDKEYIFPTTIKTFAKIWITDKWTRKNIDYNDYLTISFKNIESEEIYYFKFNYAEFDNKWLFTDYYKLG